MIGRYCGHYHILEKLGQGSMGVVYRAEHVKLKHQVVLKFLRPELVDDETRRGRFLREAEIAASLDSPAICSVIDFGEWRDEEVGYRFYLVMRYFAGTTLKDRLAAGPLPIEKVLQYGIQIAEGLQSAHTQNVVHRDIKPSNIIIGSHVDESGSTLPVELGDGDDTIDAPVMIEQAKITDFGLAVMTRSTRLTATNAQLGTPAYMSPEQVDGTPADRRSDIWALGAVLYEMVTGRPPFGTGAPDVVMYAVKASAPEPVRRLRPGAPAEMVWIIDKALRKNPDKRYQNVAEMLRDLRMLQQKLVSGRRREFGSWVLESRGRMLVLGSGLLAVALALVGVALVSGSSGSVEWLPRQVTAGIGWEGEPAVSPDGGRIAYASDESGNLDIRVVTTRGGTALRLTDHPAADTEPAWHPDGSVIYFVSDRSGRPGIWQVGVMGGEPGLVIDDAEDPAVSPDGTRLAFSRADSSGSPRIFVALLDGLADPVQLTFAGHGTIAHFDPAWSPDGRAICYGTYDDLWTVPAAGGTPRRLTTGGTADMSPTWSPSGDQIYFSSLRQNTLALWSVSASGGEAKRITPGSAPEESPCLSPDGALMAYTTSTKLIDDNVAISRLGSRNHHLIEGRQHTYQSALRPDGNMICYVTKNSFTGRELWLQDLEEGVPTGAPRRLTDQSGAAAQPAFSPDGRWVAYYRITGQDRAIWTVPAGGGPPLLFSEGQGRDLTPVWSPDGSRLAFSSDRDGAMAIYTAPVAAGRRTGPAVRVLPDGIVANLPTWSPDGRHIACVTHREGRDDVAIFAADGSGEVRWLALDADVDLVRWVRSTGDLLVSAIWGNELALRRVDPVTGRDEPLDPPFRFSPDVYFAYFNVDSSGTWITYEFSEHEGDIWILEATTGMF